MNIVAAEWTNQITGSALLESWLNDKDKDDDVKSLSMTLTGHCVEVFWNETFWRNTELNKSDLQKTM